MYALKTIPFINPKNHYVMKKLTIVLMLALAVMGVKADDFGLWTGIGVGQNLGVRGLNADLDLGFRANNSVRNVDRWSAALGVSYSICPYLKVGATYAYMYGFSPSERKEHYKNDDGVNWNGYNKTGSYWRSKNRFAFDIKTGFDVGRFSLSLRERYQLTGYNGVTVSKAKHRFNTIYDADGKVNYIEKSDSPELSTEHKARKSKEYLRSKAEVSYNIRHCPLTPCLSVELENNLREGFHLDEVRYSVGADYKLSKKLHVGAYYHFNNGHDDDSDDDLHAIEISLKLKNIFWRAKK